MEIVKKRISLNPHISRHTGLIPYITVNGETNTLIMDEWTIDTTTFSKNGNWGKIPYDIDIKRCKTFASFNGIGNIIPSELSVFFGNERLSHSMLTTMFNELKDDLSTMPFYRLIEKNGNKKWVLVDLSIYEKLNWRTIANLPLPDSATETEYGLYNNPRFSDYNFSKLFQFLLKAMGMFVVDSSYIKQNNGVPEVMYYMGIDTYLTSMNEFKNAPQCCRMKEYEFMGGDLFYNYLSYKRNEISKEIEYWHNALYRDELKKIVSPFINIPLALNSEYNNIGIYTAVPNTEETLAITDERKFISEIESLSQLKFLRRSNITYATIYKNGKEETVEFPMILDESIVDENGVVIEYELGQPYKVGFLKNITKGELGYYYGDMIYRMDFIETDKVVNIYYVIGGKFDFKNGRYVYVDVPEVPETMPVFENFVKNPKSISSWTIDMYLYMRNELSREELYDNENICFKGEYNGSTPPRTDEEKNQTWVFKTNDGNYIIDNGEDTEIFDFSLSIVTVKKFSGIRFFEQKKWVEHSFKNDIYSIKMLLDNYVKSMNILSLDGYVKNVTNAKLVDYSNTNEVIKGLYYVCEKCEDTNVNSIIALEQDFGKIDMIVENSYDVLFDRGYVTSFELHYKLGEINTMEDMENYGNNFFGF